MFEGAIQYGINERRSNSYTNNARGSVLNYIQKSNSLNADCYCGKSNEDIQKNIAKKHNKKALDKVISFVIGAGALALGTFAVIKNPASKEKLNNIIGQLKTKFSNEKLKNFSNNINEKIYKTAEKAKAKFQNKAPKSNETIKSVFQKVKDKFSKK